MEKKYLLKNLELYKGVNDETEDNHIIPQFLLKRFTADKMIYLNKKKGIYNDITKQHQFNFKGKFSCNKFFSQSLEDSYQKNETRFAVLSQNWLKKIKESKINKIIVEDKIKDYVEFQTNFKTDDVELIANFYYSLFLRTAKGRGFHDQILSKEVLLKEVKKQPVTVGISDFSYMFGRNLKIKKNIINTINQMDQNEIFKWFNDLYGSLTQHSILYELLKNNLVKNSKFLIFKEKLPICDLVWINVDSINDKLYFYEAILPVSSTVFLYVKIPNSNNNYTSFLSNNLVEKYLNAIEFNAIEILYPTLAHFYNRRDQKILKNEILPLNQKKY